ALEWTGHAQGRSFLGGEAEAAIVGRVADEDDRAVRLSTCQAECTAHQRRADPVVAEIGGHSDRAEQQGRLAGAADDVPKPGRADDALAIRRDESEPFGWGPPGRPPP